MRTDHRRPLAAYCFAALACALVIWQPSLATNAAGPGPVVKILAQNGLFPSEFLARVTGGGVLEAAASPAPVSGAGFEPAGDVQLASAPAATAGGQATVAGLDADVFVSDDDGGPSHAPGDRHADDPVRTDHPRQGPEDKPEGHPGKGPKDTPEGHPGKGPKSMGPQADGHPGKGPKDKGWRADGHPGKGPKDKGWQRDGHPGKGPKGKRPRGGARHDPGSA